MDTIDAIAIVLALVSLAVTVIGFFASLRFYQDGMKLQALATEALAKIEEKTQTIQSQVGGMFDKTLDAAIGKQVQLDSDFEAIEQQIESSARTIIDSAVRDIGAAGKEERERVAAVVQEQVSLIRTRVEETRDSAEEAVEPRSIALPRSDMQAQALAVVASMESGATTRDVSGALGVAHSTALRVVRKLADRGLIVIDGSGKSVSYRASVKGKSIVHHAAKSA